MLEASKIINILVLEGGTDDKLSPQGLFQSLILNGYIPNHKPMVFFKSFLSFNPHGIFT